MYHFLFIFWVVVLQETMALRTGVVRSVRLAQCSFQSSRPLGRTPMRFSAQTSSPPQEQLPHQPSHTSSFFLSRNVAVPNAGKSFSTESASSAKGIPEPIEYEKTNRTAEKSDTSVSPEAQTKSQPKTPQTDPEPESNPFGDALSPRRKRSPTKVKNPKATLYITSTLAAAALIASGFTYGYCKERNLTARQFFNLCITVGNKKLDVVAEFLNSYLDVFFPQGAEPLLPDRHELQIPDRVPTLVVNVDGVVLWQDKEHISGPKCIKRPGADRFFKELAQFYEIVLWSSEEYPACETIVEKWGLYQIVLGVLYREQCDRVRGRPVKNLSRLGRPLDRVVILDCEPASFLLQPENGIHIRPFKGESGDADLEDLIDFLKMLASTPEDVRSTLARFGGGDIDLPHRWAEYKGKQEKKASSRRSFGKALIGGVESSGQFGNKKFGGGPF
eukprot:GHVN01053214.1.p1 GENE.GHVN01053214.1~~GHVN01053214.1.p1  ORF type:complete len:445 (+),score=50.96 GHVN01053214.1:1526-2860(+)